MINELIHWRRDRFKKKGRIVVLFCMFSGSSSTLCPATYDFITDRFRWIGTRTGRLIGWNSFSAILTGAWSWWSPHGSFALTARCSCFIDFSPCRQQVQRFFFRFFFFCWLGSMNICLPQSNIHPKEANNCVFGLPVIGWTAVKTFVRVFM